MYIINVPRTDCSCYADGTKNGTKDEWTRVNVTTRELVAVERVKSEQYKTKKKKTKTRTKCSYLSIFVTYIIVHHLKVILRIYVLCAVIAKL